MISVPFVDLKAQYETIREEIDLAIEEVVHSANFIGGPMLDTFEREFAAFVGAQYSVGVGNGTDALTLALQAAGLRQGDEVLIPANSFFASAEAVSNAGGNPVFVDVDPLTFHMSPEATARAINKRTRAILPVHLYGRSVDMSPFERLAKEHDLLIVEDCAQAHGAEFGGATVGSSGRLTCYSFYPGKNLGAYGDGGAITTNDPKLNTKLRTLRDHGSLRKYDHSLIGHNSRLDAIQAAVLSVKLPYLHRWNAARRDHAKYYAMALSGSPILAPEIPSGNEHVFHLFVIRCSKRDQLQQFLSEHNIATGIHYPVPLHLTPAYQSLGVPGKGSNPVSETIAQEILSLPMYPELSESQLQHVTDTLRDFITSHDLATVDLHIGRA